MAMPKKGHVRVAIYVDPAFWKQVQEESKQRKIPQGLLIEEAFRARMMMIRK